MEIFYNELSINPLASNHDDARYRIIKLLNTMKSLKDEVGIDIMRAHNGFYGDYICSNYTFGHFFGDDSVNSILKTLLLTIVASPYIEDDDSFEAEQFITNSFETNNEVNVSVIPEGLANAFIFNSPSISISSHPYWINDKLILNITDSINSQDIIQSEIPNLYSPSCFCKPSFQNWLDLFNPSIEMNSEENIYMIFPSEQFLFDSQAVQDIISWFYDDKRYLKRVKELIEDISSFPFQGGIGRTERLLGTSNKASKRIVKKDRIVYTYTLSKITIHQCKGHYDDH